MIRNSERRRALLASTSLMATLAAFAPGAFAGSVLPTQGSVASGAASINQSGAALTVTQTTPRAIVNWNSFSIGAGDSVTFVQPNAAAATLNRVTGATPSSIAGQLNANGQVYLVNPNGIAITRSGTVNVGGGFVASTLGIADKDFNDGRLNFSGSGASAAVSNEGAITAAPGGFVGLLGGSVSNAGTISAPLGKVALGSGEQATLDLSGDGFLQVALPTNATTADGKALVDVSGTIKAAGGRVAIKAATAASAVRNAINLSGYASARSARAVGGSIILDGGAGGDVSVSGALNASGRRGGGSLSVAGRNVTLNHARLMVQSGAGKGGAVTVTAHNAVTLTGASIRASGATGGGSIAIGAGPMIQAVTATIDAGSVLRADALQTGGGGSIVVRSLGATFAAGAFSARGGAISGDGGSVETSGATLNVANVHVDTTAAHGLTGSWLLDPTDFTVAPSGGDITGATLSAELATTNVTIQSSAGATAGSGDIVVNDAISWSSVNTLTLDAFRNVSVNADITVQGAGGVAFIVGDTAQNGVGSNAGALQFALTDAGPKASLSFTGVGGALSINGNNFTLLRTEADLGALAATPAGNFALANDIALSQSYATSVVPDFYGRLEGLGHNIQNLNLAQGGAATNVGFFGVLDAAGSGTPANPPAGAYAQVSNLFLANASVNGGAATGVGVLAGENFGQVFNSGSSGAVTGAGAQVGGLVGANVGLVDTGYSAAAVTATSAGGTTYVGGLVGLNTGGVVNAFASGAVQGNNEVGGLVGLNSGYVNGGASGFVIGDASVGGVVGQNNANQGDFVFQGVDYGANGAVEGAFGYGGVFGTIDAGGVVGLNTGSVSFSFFNGPVSGNAGIGGVIGENDGLVSNDFAIGPVSGTTDVGGLVGFNNGAVDSSFAMGAVRGSTNVGGLVGLEGSPTATSSLSNTFSTGAVSGTTGFGGLVGLVGGADDTITTSYYDTLTSGQTASAGGIGHTTAELQGAAALPLGGAFSGGAAGGETGVYPYLTGIFANGVRAISGFAYKDSAGTVPLVSGPNGAATVFADISSNGGAQRTIKQPGTTGANGYYYIFVDVANAAAGSNVVVYTPADAATGSTNAATYLASAGANNTTGVNIRGLTFTETTALPTYSQLVAAVTDATQGDAAGPAAIAGVSYIDIVSTGANFLIDQPISTTADLTVTGATTLAQNVTATGGVNFNSPVTLGATVAVDSGAATTLFAGGVNGSAAAGRRVGGERPRRPRRRRDHRQRRADLQRPRHRRGQSRDQLRLCDYDIRLNNRQRGRGRDHRLRQLQPDGNRGRVQLRRRHWRPSRLRRRFVHVGRRPDAALDNRYVDLRPRDRREPHARARNHADRLRLGNGGDARRRRGVHQQRRRGRHRPHGAVGRRSRRADADAAELADLLRQSRQRRFRRPEQQQPGDLEHAVPRRGRAGQRRLLPVRVPADGDVRLDQRQQDLRTGLHHQSRDRLHRQRRAGRGGGRLPRRYSGGRLQRRAGGDLGGVARKCVRRRRPLHHQRRQGLARRARRLRARLRLHRPTDINSRADHHRRDAEHESVRRDDHGRRAADPHRRRLAGRRHALRVLREPGPQQRRFADPGRGLRRSRGRRQLRGDARSYGNDAAQHRCDPAAVSA